jgi:hypothetical protein
MCAISIADLFKVGPPLTEAEQVGRTPSIDALSDRAMAGGTLRLFDRRREGKRERFKHADLSLEEPALERLLDLSTGQPYCTMLLARQCAELGGAFGTVNVDVVELALPTVERHEAWQLLRYS